MVKLLSSQNINGKEVENMKRNKKKGFTLIELIVVIAILGILAAVAVPRISGFQTTAKKKADVSNARLIANAASIAVAEGKTVNDGDTLAETGLSAYLDTWPTLQSATGTFTLDIDGDSVSVKDGSGSSAKEIYPETDADFK